ncbi:ribokinase [Fervidobacterium gondwanense]|uniref:ribokinase n=1 Tax=Fervidobacterium gondwanense TaxID=44754 RepID=UPI003C767E15
MISVIGSSNMDIVLTVEHFTKPGETQKILNLEYFPGGKGANQAVAAAKLSKSEVFFLTMLGNDSYGSTLAKNYEKLGISGYKFADTNTGLAFIEVTLSGENRIMITPGANAHLTPGIVNESIGEILKTDILLLQNEIPFESTLFAARLFKDAGKLVIFDPAPARGITPEIFPYVDIMTPNEEELRTLSENIIGRYESIEKTFEAFKEKGLKAMIVKQGENGATYIDEKAIFTVPTKKVEPVDTTAAGDVFNGALAVALNERRNIQSAIQFANICAAISVTRKGAQPSIPDREEVEFA